MLVTPGQYHYMVSIEEMIQHALDKTALHKMVLCEKHNNEQMVYYCNTCNVSADSFKYFISFKMYLVYLIILLLF